MHSAEGGDVPEGPPPAPIRRSVLLSRAQDDALKEVSAQQGYASLNSLIRQAIDAWLKRKRR